MRPTRPQEIQAVLQLAGPKRFEHFVKRVVDDEAAWGLWKDGWGLMEDDDGAPVFPLWPATEYAELNKLGDWTAYEATSISLEDLLNDLLPKLSENKVRAGVFPTPGGKGVVVSSEELMTALNRELERYR